LLLVKLLFECPSNMSFVLLRHGTAALQCPTISDHKRESNHSELCTVLRGRRQAVDGYNSALLRQRNGKC
jgi:hypothetical protein